MAVNVARIYEQVIRPGHRYCKICLRSASETTLVTPRNLLQFTNSLKMKVFDGPKALSACIVCEASAGTALRMYQACVNAVSIKNVCQPLKNMELDEPVPEWLRTAILGCNANLKEHRQRTSLQQTEVLVVDSVGIEWQQDIGSGQPKIAPPTMISNCPKKYETVVLDDDDEPQTSAGGLTPAVPRENILNTDPAMTILPNQMQILAKQNDNSYVLHPLILQDGKLVAPTLAGHVKEGELLVLDSAASMGNSQKAGNVIQADFAIGRGDSNQQNVKKNSRFRSECTVQSNSETESLLRRYLDDDSENANGPISAKRKKDSEVNDFITNSSDSDPIAVISNVMTGVRDEGFVKEVLSRAPGLVEKSGKIDWEDKIPMDVISFVDATDPNLLIVPDPLPVSQTHLENVKPIVKDNVIDLC